MLALVAARVVVVVARVVVFMIRVVASVTLLALFALGFALALALFAVVVGGFLWPRPQFRRGPWAGPGPAPADSLGAPIEVAPAP